MQFYNVHTHIFTMSNAPTKFLELYMPKVAANVVDKVTNTSIGSWIIRKGLETFGGDGGKRYASFLKIGKSKNQNDVLRHLLEQYEDSSMKVVALTLNMENIGADHSLSGYEGQIEEILTVKRRYPERLLVFFCIDPRWKATGKQIKEQVEYYFNQKIVSGNKEYYPFAGLKIYPSTGFYAFDEKLKPVLEWAAAHRVPVMTHCSYLGGIFNNDVNFLKASLNPYDPYSGAYYKEPCFTITDKKPRVNNQNMCSYFLEPWSYKSMLEYFKKKGTPLKICFAHFGGSDHMMLTHKNDNTGTFFGTQKGKNWTAQIRELMTEYDSVYTDISYSLASTKTHEFIFKELDNPAYGGRILFGTDFFMTERESSENKTYTDFKTKSLMKERTDAKNAWEKIAMENAERYLKSDFYQG